MTKKNPYNILTKPQKLFVLSVVDGMEPEKACKLAYPKERHNQKVRLANLYNTAKITEAMSYLTKHTLNKDGMFAKLNRIVHNPRAKASTQLSAVKLLATLAGVIKRAEPYQSKKKRQQNPELPDEHVRERLQELAEKANPSVI